MGEEKYRERVDEQPGNKGENRQRFKSGEKKIESEIGSLGKERETDALEKREEATQ